MKPLTLTFIFLTGILIGRSLPHEAKATDRVITEDDIRTAYELGKQDKMDDIGLVRLTENDIEILTKE